MSIGTLYTTTQQAKGKRVCSDPLSSFRLRIIHDLLFQILAAAAFAGLSLDLAEGYTHYVDNKKPEFLSKFPHGKIPALETKDGFYLFEGTAVAGYGESCSYCIVTEAERKRNIYSVIPVLIIMSRIQQQLICPSILSLS